MPSNDYQLPGVARRLGSLLYELLLVFALLLAASALSTPLIAQVGRTPLSSALNGLYFALLLFGYFGLSWRRSGQTVAMKAWRLSLHRADGGPLSWGWVLRRFLLAALLYGALPLLAYRGLTAVASVADRLFLALLWWALPLGWAWFDPERQFLHDRLAGTRQWYLPRPPRPDKKNVAKPSSAQN